MAAVKSGDAKKALIQFFCEFFTSDTWGKLLEIVIDRLPGVGHHPGALLAGIRDATGVLVPLTS